MDLRNEIESLVAELTKIYKESTGMDYEWRDFEKDIVREMLLAGMPALAIEDRWLRALRNREAGQMKGLKLLMLREKGGAAPRQRSRKRRSDGMRQYEIVARPMGATQPQPELTTQKDRLRVALIAAISAVLDGMDARTR